ncbi:MAG: pimeloyl-ACP methyl ester carboxylesterase/DNA-binding winged helix-turn-helix (wHTH) protein [Paracoccaceae bacterium]|jgi:pimeloyl-ACP methyl ester carboxylesterase/DNA-binding winged helix-turn-helix (wHTH) protein
MIYRFGDYSLDSSGFELRHGDDVVPVEPQVFSILTFMIENRAQVVSSDDLIASVWNGRIVSEATLSSRISAARRAVGDSGASQKIIRTIRSRGFRFMAEVTETEDAQSGNTASPVAPFSNQKIRFCESDDGTQIAYATIGAGVPLVRAGHWLTHLEHDWHSPVWRPLLDEFAKTFQVSRYDQRGNGLSDWSIRNTSLDAFVDDLEAVVDAAKLDRFALYGTSQGAPIAVSYAVRHPERVSHLILHGGYVRGRTLRASEAEREQGEAILALMRHGWGKEGSPFIKAFTSMYIPDGTKEQIDSLADLQAQTVSPENAVVLRTAVDNFDVSELLAKVSVPSLVIHARNDGVQPLDEGRKLAAGIKDSEFVLLDSANHAPLKQEAAWDRLFEVIGDFVHR